ncbi:uncharacterized protein METZ01_LOCUS210422 [marine metagenome]|uniref:Phage tail collar domain-containing protein n=1 Tax=marine metagenome TaxID=408172 RepID=A0A382F3J0_9ZZZZ
MANTTNFSIEKASVGGARNSWGGINNVGIDKIDELLALAMPLGTIQMYPLSTAPVPTANGGTWLICDGGTKVRTDFPDLYTLIGSTYGTEPSASTFLLPDLRARVPVGYNVAAIGSGVTVRSIRAMAATSGGTEGHILTEGELDQHEHPLPLTTHVHAFTTADKATGITETNLAKSNVTLNDHSHTGEKWTDYQASDAGAGQLVQSMYINPRRQDLDFTVSTFSGAALLKDDGDSNNGHKHTLTDPEHKHTGTTDPKVTGITTTNSTGSSSSHNNMQPFIVVQYIILAKHPSF